jgi:hypothetical protein
MESQALVQLIEENFKIGESTPPHPTFPLPARFILSHQTTTVSFLFQIGERLRGSLFFFSLPFGSFPSRKYSVLFRCFGLNMIIVPFRVVVSPLIQVPCAF